MGRELLTSQAKAQIGNFPTNNIETAVKLTHDIFLLAAQQKMTIWMTCGSLRQALRDRYALDVTGVTFAQSVREVLDVGQNVSILLWNDPESDQPFSPALAALLASLKSPCPHPRGVLKIRSTGSQDGWERVTHFVAATGTSKQVWYLRAEAPHKPLTGDHLNRDQDPVVPAAAMLATEEARKCGKQLVDAFGVAFAAAGQRARDNNAAGIYYARQSVVVSG